jgi:hypothetical protein
MLAAVEDEEFKPTGLLSHFPLRIFSTLRLTGMLHSFARLDGSLVST